MESIWQMDKKLTKFPKCNGNLKTDVLIIGGGMAGILTVYFLEQDNVSYLLVEKERVCQDVTAGTTAKITSQHGLKYYTLLRDSGIAVTQGYLQANQLAEKAYRKLCKTIDCKYEIKDNFVYTLDDKSQLEQELSTLSRIGFDGSYTEHLPLPFRIAGAVRFPNQAQFHPLKFAAAIAEHLHIYENTWIREIRGNTAVFDSGSITADTIIVTTHFPFLNRYGCYFLKLYQFRSYLIALENAPNLNGMYVDASSTGFSFRNTQKYLLLGGGGHRTGKDGGNWTELRNLYRCYYPQAKEICYWAVQDCVSLDGIPYIGHYSNCTKQWYVATGFQKWGMTGAMLSALLLRDMVQEKKNEFAEIFSPSRSIWKSKLLENSWETAKRFFRISKKRCPHMGCALTCNKAEHS